MKCRDTRKVLSRYLDQELSSTQMAPVEEHLVQCPECRAEHATQERLWTLLGRAEPIKSPDMRAAIEARLSERRRWTSFLDGFRLRSLGYAAATAAVVLVFVSAGVWAGTARHGSGSGEQDRAFVELLSDAPPGMEVVALLDEIGERP